MKYLKNGLLASASILASLPYPSSSFASSAEEILFTQDASTSLPTLSIDSIIARADKIDGAIDIAVWVQPAVIDRINATGVNAEQYIDEMLNEWTKRSNNAFSDSGITTPLRLVFAGVTENVPDTCSGLTSYIA
ncbi:hypothetical protein [Pseudoalteromonas sp.]|uniref:hypothetical protein n=1 Tax=Pseudoalteromonas sp. TaxID=53249 RepID=UPI0026177FDA|nr:hypothetical protein [Pseudoalteromonas sp.]MCP3865556.1 hypothetical protein [Aestuariibacter sp.]MCP4588925.1 hypothetical protein [Pseudoalteromonas sp.]